MRTDIHRPSTILPQDYTFVAFDIPSDSYEGNMASKWAANEKKVFKDHLACTGGGFSKHAHGGTCHVCGATAVYHAIFYHAKTNSYILTGRDCAEKMGFRVYGNWNRFRREVRWNKDMKTGQKKAQVVLIEKGFTDSWKWYTLAGDFDPSNLKDISEKEWKRWNYTVATHNDIVSKLVRWGSISDKQWEFLSSLVKQINNFETDVLVERKKFEKEIRNRQDAPVGRQEIRGVILGMKSIESQYGSTLKMLVKDDRGFKVWASVPYTIDYPKRGMRVQFTANLTVSKNDKYFAYGKRPTKAKVIS